MRKYRFLQWFLLAFVMLAVPAASHAQVRIGVSVRIGPPALPVYEQPLCPGPAISGRPAIGPMVMTATIGFPEHG